MILFFYQYVCPEVTPKTLFAKIQVVFLNWPLHQKSLVFQVFSEIWAFDDVEHLSPGYPFKLVQRNFSDFFFKYKYILNKF